MAFKQRPLRIWQESWSHPDVNSITSNFCPQPILPVFLTMTDLPSSTSSSSGYSVSLASAPTVLTLNWSEFNFACDVHLSSKSTCMFDLGLSSSFVTFSFCCFECLDLMFNSSQGTNIHFRCTIKHKYFWWLVGDVWIWMVKIVVCKCGN